jgi:phage shock protein E
VTLMKVGAVLLLVGAAAAILFVRSRSDTIVSSDARRLVTAGAKLVDVRTPEEYAQGHLEGAVNIPVQELSQRMSEMGSPTTTVVLYCRSGKRSRRAKEMLLQAGFTSVHDLGAMSRW